MSFPCPCQSGHNFGNCCLPYLNGFKHPETCEALMRSRFTAYHQIDMRYIRHTMKPPASREFSAKKSKLWARSVKWLELNILATEAGGPKDDEGYVTFEIHYLEAGQKHFMREKSRFEKHQERWFYVEGIEHEEA